MSPLKTPSWRAANPLFKWVKLMIQKVPIMVQMNQTRIECTVEREALDGWWNILKRPVLLFGLKFQVWVYLEKGI